MESNSSNHNSELQNKLGYRITELEKELDEYKNKAIADANE